MTPRENIKRPLIVTILVIAVFCISIGHAISLYSGFSRQAFFSQLTMSISLTTLLILSGFWMITWLAVAIMLWMGISQARLGTIAMLVVYHLSRIGLVLFMAEGAYERGRIPMMVITGIWTTALIAFALTRQSVKFYYEDIVNTVAG